MLTHRPIFFLTLFPVSAAFWWIFEYLNRFVQNWNYTGTHYGAINYFVLATLAFSTVLPAVLGTKEYLQSFSWLKLELKLVIPFTINRPKVFAVIILIVSATVLGMIGVFPDFLFPVLWLSPLVILVSLSTLSVEQHFLYLNSISNQKAVIAAMIAALVCGFFWEMWNYWSLVKWYYAIPFVDKYLLFEMPILGYAGYLPFGLECAMIGELIEGKSKQV